MRPRPAPLMFMAVAVATLGLASAESPVSAGTAKVLRVGTYKGIAGTFGSIQAAIDAAHAG
ncbi:MAG TPA: hypothetical protein VKJ07_16860, partial [Mycobacteriales bacterium]|nr:hypothetical protein [Mycobacteriales bacterium]